MTECLVPFILSLVSVFTFGCPRSGGTALSGEASLSCSVRNEQLMEAEH